jgi:hypothetical protein
MPFIVTDDLEKIALKRVCHAVTAKRPWEGLYYFMGSLSKAWTLTELGNAFSVCYGDDSASGVR